MNSLSLTFVCVAAFAILALPRRWVCLPFLAAACYITYGQGIDIGPYTFYVIRLLLLAGLARVVVRQERPSGGLNALDRVVIAWAGAAVVSSVGHDDPSAAIVFRLGLVYDYAGIYFLARTFVATFDDAALLLRIIALLLLPVALEMIAEKLSGQNRFAMFGGVPEMCFVREGTIRAQGPFMHPILAGTVGAVCLPLMAGLWRIDRKTALIGLGATIVMTLASGSSGPMMSAIFATGALALFHHRRHLRTLRWLAVIIYFLLNLVMNVPAYFLIARLDLAGGSTGWHRAQLIDSALKHLDEWWLVGTDYTRHWMPSAGGWNQSHCDTTNHYILMGVWGGLPLMLLFIGMFWLAFSYIGRSLDAGARLGPHWRFLIWTLGASLFANAATCVSVAYFDQSFLFLVLVLGSIGSLLSMVGSSDAATQDEPDGGTAADWQPRPAI